MRHAHVAGHSIASADGIVQIRFDYRKSQQARSRSSDPESFTSEICQTICHNDLEVPKSSHAISLRTPLQTKAITTQIIIMGPVDKSDKVKK